MFDITSKLINSVHVALYLSLLETHWVVLSFILHVKCLAIRFYILLTIC